MTWQDSSRELYRLGRVGSRICFCSYCGTTVSGSQGDRPRKGRNLPHTWERTEVDFRPKVWRRRMCLNSPWAALVVTCLCPESGHAPKSAPLTTGVTDGKDPWGPLAKPVQLTIYLQQHLLGPFSPSVHIPEDCFALSLKSQFWKPLTIYFRPNMQPGWEAILNFPKHHTEA